MKSAHDALSQKSYHTGYVDLILSLLAPFTPTIDFYCAEYFYTPETGFYNNAFFACLFKYGELFGLATGVFAAGVFALSLFPPEMEKMEERGFDDGLTLALGAGLMTNLGFKEYWGRPRPKQVVEFGGKHAYRPFWNPDLHTRHDPQRSFPSGHVAMGFYFLSFGWLASGTTAPY